MKKKFKPCVFFISAIVTLLTGFLQNNPEIGVPEIKYFGYPLAWRTEALQGAQEIMYLKLLLDLLFWIIVFGVINFLIKRQLAKTY